MAASDPLFVGLSCLHRVRAYVSLKMSFLSRELKTTMWTFVAYLTRTICETMSLLSRRVNVHTDGGVITPPISHRNLSPCAQ